ncbi:hypothetical protein B0H14DRAFT_3473241 [Mycena olivaceomarginata]|nr:hypothetical protein B0H14DRAFT_3473241 [Mycena olivaceomarginata]
MTPSATHPLSSRTSGDSASHSPGFSMVEGTPARRAFLPTQLEDGCPHLLPFVHNSSCSLTALVLMSCGICPELVQVLHGLPSLTYVLIESPDERHGETGGQYEHTVALFEALKISGTPTVDALCPTLTSFVFGFSPKFPHNSFFSMARSRLHWVAV